MGLLEKVRASLPERKDSGGWSQPPFWQLDDLRYGLFATSTWDGRREQIENNYLGYVEGILKRNGPVYALIAMRLLIFSEARLKFRTLGSGPSKLFGTPDLALMEHPWPNATTGDLLGRMLLDADLSGNCYLTVVNGHVRRMRPDRTVILTASREEPDLFGRALDAEIIGYMYEPMGQNGLGSRLLLPEQVAHFAPMPDPDSNWRGMSWLTPLLRDISSDQAATEHKLKFFENGATPQVIVSYDASITPEKFKKYREMIGQASEGIDKAYKTLHLGGGADAKVVGANLQQLDFKVTQGAGETRLAAAAGVPSAIVGFSEGLHGSSLNSSTYGAARRRFADGTLRPLWRNAVQSLQTLVNVPAGAELWYDERDIAFLREDRKDEAEIQSTEAQTIRNLLDAGFEHDSVVLAVQSHDWSVLQHTGLYSVQLQPPGTAGPPALPPANPPPA